MKGRRLTILSFFFLLIVSCNNEEKKEASKEFPRTESKALNKFIEAAAVQYINLDTIPTIKINITDDNIIFYSANEDAENYVGYMRNFIAERDLIYVYNFDRHNIVGVCYNGFSVGPVTKDGRGPGELETFEGGMDSNSKNIFVSDANNARINIYSKEFKFIETISSIRVNDVKINDEYIAYNRYATEYQGVKTSGLISIAAVNDPLKVISKIMPKIIPDGYEPRVFNGVDFNINRRSEIAASYSHLPWISLFDEKFELERTLIIEDSDFLQRDLVPLKIEKINPGNRNGIGGETIFTRFEILDNGDLFIIDEEIIHLKRLVDRSYAAIARYKINYTDAEETFWVDQINVLPNGKIIASNWYYLFEFELPDK